MPVQAPVVACLGCCNRIPQTESLQQQKFVFLPFWRLGNPRSRCQLTQFPWEPSSWPAEAPSPLCLFPLHRRPQSHQIRAPPWWPHFTLIASRRLPPYAWRRVRLTTSAWVWRGHSSVCGSAWAPPRHLPVSSETLCLTHFRRDSLDPFSKHFLGACYRAVCPRDFAWAWPCESFPPRHKIEWS